MSWAAVVLGVGTAVAAGGQAYSASQQKKSAAQRDAAIRSGVQGVEPTLLGDPAMIDTRAVNFRTIDQASDFFPYSRQLAEKANAFSYKELVNYLRRIQPSFDAIQRLIGQNAVQAAFGQLPDDVAAEINRRATERGIQGGYGFGTQGFRTGAGANLNLRNLGLTSLDLMKYGNQLGLQVNQSARSLLPSFINPIELGLSAGQQLQAEGANVDASNQFTLQNNRLLNNATMENTALQNNLVTGLAQSGYRQDVADAQMIQQIGQLLGGTIGDYGSRMRQQPASAAYNTSASAPAQTWQQNASSFTGRGLA